MRSMTWFVFLFFPGIVVFALWALLCTASAAKAQKYKRELKRGFEEYDSKKEKELLTLRRDIQVLLQRQKEDMDAGRHAPPPPLPPTQPLVPLMPVRTAPCPDCDVMRQSIVDKERDLKDHRETHATLLSKNNEIDTQLRLMCKVRWNLLKLSINQSINQSRNGPIKFIFR